MTSRIVEQLAKGVTPWVKPWQAGNTEGRIIRPLRHNFVPYNGINVLLLWGSALEKGFTSPVWMTFRQADELGAHVRKGEHGSLVVFANTITKTQDDGQGGETEREIGFMRAYTVFNTEQVEDLPELYRARPPPKFTSTLERHDNAEAFFAATNATIITRGAQPLYSEASDHILMPPFESFFERESYYATLAHESIHWTKHPQRLAREFGRKRWGDEGYAAEELVAELGSAFLCADLEITPEVSDRHAAYISSWLRVLMDDNRAIFQAASYAQKAVDYLHALQPQSPPQPENDQPVPAEP